MKLAKALSPPHRPEKGRRQSPVRRRRKSTPPKTTRPRHIHLELKPHPGTNFARKFRLIDVSVDPVSAMPVRIQTTDIGNSDVSNYKSHRPHRRENKPRPRRQRFSPERSPQRLDLRQRIRTSSTNVSNRKRITIRRADRNRRHPRNLLQSPFEHLQNPRSLLECSVQTAVTPAAAAFTAS